MYLILYISLNLFLIAVIPFIVFRKIFKNDVSISMGKIRAKYLFFLFISVSSGLAATIIEFFLLKRISIVSQIITLIIVIVFFFLFVKNRFSSKKIKYTVVFGLTLLLCTGLVLAIKKYLVSGFFVEGSSMSPALNDGEYVIATKIGRHENGDVVIYKNNRSDGNISVKRIIISEGDVVDFFDQDHYIISGKRLEVNNLMPIPVTLYIPEKEKEKDTINLARKSTISKNNFIVAGDNELGNEESLSEYQIIESKDIVGKILKSGLN